MGSLSHAVFNLLHPDGTKVFYIYKIPSGSRNVEKVFRKDGYHWFLDSKGRVFAGNAPMRRYDYIPGKWSWQDSLLKALIKWGKITQKDADFHLAVIEKRSEQRSKNWSIIRSFENFKNLGLKPTKDMVYLAEENWSKFSYDCRSYWKSKVGDPPVEEEAS